MIDIPRGITNASPSLSSDAIGEYCFGFSGKVGVAAVINMCLIGACCCALVLFATTLNTWVPSLGMSWWIVISTAVASPIVFLKSLRQLSMISPMGIPAIILLNLTIIVCGISECFQASADDVYVEHSMVRWDLFSFATAFSNCVFAFNVTPIGPAVVHGLVDARKFPRCAWTANCVILLVCLAGGLSGYAGWGNATKSMTAVQLIDISSQRHDGFSIAKGGLIVSSVRDSPYLRLSVFHPLLRVGHIAGLLVHNHLRR